MNAGTDRRGIDPRTGRPRRFAYPPQLLVIDGGAPQVNAAAGALADIGVVDVTVCGLAKRLEEVWVPGQDEPVIFPRTSEALYLLQRLRDEAHRFAITFHREKRSKSMTVSALDAIAGARPARRKALIRHFGSVAALRQASVDERDGRARLRPRTAQASWRHWPGSRLGNAEVPSRIAPSEMSDGGIARENSSPSSDTDTARTRTRTRLRRRHRGVR